MKKKSYLDKESNITTDYSKNNSYILDGETTLSPKYILLPEEYDMFSELDQSFFTNDETEQQRFISKCLLYMKECLVDFYNKNGVVCILPKLKNSQDSEGTITFNMALSTFRAYISFEEKESSPDGYFGIISQKDEYSVSSETIIITIENYEEMIRIILQIIINNS